MSSLESLKKAILEDGVIDESEVKEIRAVLYDDGEIDQEEADFMFELNDAVSGKANHASWEDLFVESICDFLLNDEASPGEIDDDETNWLVAKIEGDGQLDATELKLLSALKTKAKSFPDKLNQLLN